MNKPFFTLLPLALALAFEPVHAEALSESAWQVIQSAKPAGDAALGQSLYAERGCAGCHGSQGIPDNKEWPILAGQRSLYVYKILLDYRDKRVGGASAQTMAGVAAGLQEQDMANLAAWLGSLRRPSASGLSGSVPTIAKGDRSRLIPPCEACHGANGQGWDLQPAIAGQHRAYLSAALHRFKSAERANDINDGMAQFARKLNEDEIRQLSVFYGR
jgi:cytochrome c553